MWSHLLHQAELLQLPLVIEDEAVAAWPPARQVLLSADVRHRGVQNPPPPPLHAYTHGSGVRGGKTLLFSVFLSPPQVEPVDSNQPDLLTSTVVKAG